jgi:hypothetical protein
VYGYCNGTTYWNNPDYFLSAGDGGSYPSGSSFAPGGGPAYYEIQYIYLGSTALQLSSAGPTITSISPSGGTVGTSSAMHIYGDNLVDPFTGQASAAISGSGVTLSVASATESVVDLNDSIATNATTGSQNVTLTTRFGTSNAAPFSIGDPTPIITSISPNSWNAGTSIQVTITGHGFGTNPSLTITGPGVSGYSTGAVSGLVDYFGMPSKFTVAVAARDRDVAQRASAARSINDQKKGGAFEAPPLYSNLSAV